MNEIKLLGDIVLIGAIVLTISFGAFLGWLSYKLFSKGKK